MAKVTEAAKRLVRSVEEVKKGATRDWPKGNPTPEQWETIVTDAETLKDEVSSSE